MKEVTDIISRLRGMQGSLNNSEQKVLDAILSNLEFSSNATNKTIAKKARVSEPTLTRFCKRVGCKNFQDFKIKLSRNLAIGEQYFTKKNLAQKNFVISDVLSFAFDALQKIAVQLDSEKIQQAIDLLSKTQKLAIMGLGGQSSSLATIAENRFFRLGIAGRAYCDSYLQKIAASVLNEKDVLLAISFSGRVKDILDNVNIAKQYNAKTISITKTDSPLSKLTDVSIDFNLEEDDNNYKPSSSRYGFLAVIDMLAMGVAIANGSTSLEYFRRIRSNLSLKEPFKTVIGD
jgi:DNA-binding MurR/RpiR family transcriptional regulator